MKNSVMTKDEFVMRMILIFFSQYRNRQDEEITQTPSDHFYSWSEMMDFVDRDCKRSSESWRACLQLWEVPEGYLDFFVDFIMKYKNPPAKKNRSSRLKIKDAERIFDLACVMSYALEKRSPFYNDLRAELQNTIFDLTEV